MILAVELHGESLLVQFWISLKTHVNDEVLGGYFEAKRSI